MYFDDTLGLTAHHLTVVTLSLVIGHRDKIMSLFLAGGGGRGRFLT